MFSKIYSAAEAGSDVRFLSRYDKSATNIKEADLWLKIGQVSVLSVALFATTIVTGYADGTRFHGR